MPSNAVSDLETVLAVFNEYDAVCEKMAALDYGAMSVPELFDLQTRRERQARRAPTTDHALLAEMWSRSSAKAVGAKSWEDVLAIRLRIGRTEAKRRVGEAKDLGPRKALTGEPLEPLLPATASAQANGEINAEHVSVIRKFFADPPVPLDAITRGQIDRDLARIARGNTPETLRRCAHRIAFLLNQDGDELQDAKRARKRGVTILPQGVDGMSKIYGWLDPESTATIQAVLAKLAAPGMCHPDDETPCTTGTPSAEAIKSDVRSAAQRNHDALTAMGRSVLASGELGQHNGLPVTIVVSTTLRELESGTGIAVTGSGTELPMTDVIRLASHAHHYLAVFHNHREVPLYLGRSKRIASPGQRIVLSARDRGCTRPGCTCPGDCCQCHHAKEDFAAGGQTNIDELTLACPTDNRLVTHDGWTTHIREDGRVEWMPPPLLDTGQDRINHYWHPEELFHPPEHDDP